MSTMQFGQALGATNAIIPALTQQLNWAEDDVQFYNTAISSSAVAGIAIGAIFGGSLISNGRKRIVIAFNFISIIGALVSLYPNTYAICVGRFIFAICSGVFSCATPKILDETIPAHIMDNGYGISTNLCINVYIMINMFMSLGMPADDDTEGLKDTQFWRVIYALPIPLAIVTILLNIYVHTEDSLRFHIQKK